MIFADSWGDLHVTLHAYGLFPNPNCKVLCRYGRNMPAVKLILCSDWLLHERGVVAFLHQSAAAENVDEVSVAHGT